MKFDQRDLIPRWRSVRKNVDAGEFQKLDKARDLLVPDNQEFRKLERNWLDLEGFVTASELVSFSAVAAIDSDQSKRAVAFLKDQGDTIALQMMGDETLEKEGEIGPRSLAHDARGRTRKDPRDALAWSDLSRAYTGCGNLEKAESAMRVALWLSPNSRYILRSATRLFVQMSEPDRAFRLLESHPRTVNDPWLSAAFVSVGQILGRNPKHARRLRDLSSSAAFRTIERSELQSELATLELRAGNHKKAKAAFRESLLSPTDNSLAQAAWALPGTEFSPTAGLPVPFQHEALAREAADSGDFQGALHHCKEWIEDIPFDIAAATFGSFIACVALKDWASARYFATQGLTANPGDPLLLNNLIFSEAASGRLDEAEKLLGNARKLDVVQSAPALRATEGFIDFMRGRPDAGRQKYQEALEMFSNGGDIFHELLALLLLLLQEVNSGEPLRRSEILRLMDRVELRLRRLGGPSGSRSVIGQLTYEARRQVQAMSVK
jgi:tetratricopeptide (TPR) repeat protein